MRPSTKAWIVLGASVLAYEYWAPDGELLSHGYDNFLAHHPFVTWSLTVITAAHLLNICPRVVDVWELVNYVRSS
ncbi:DUF7427 family protein [Mycobacterium intracellulare]